MLNKRGKPSLREAARRAITKPPLTVEQAKPTIAKPIEVAPKVETPAAKAVEISKPKGTKLHTPPFSSYEEIVASCGHKIPFGIWIKDKWREQRRAKHQAKPCPDCRKAQESTKQQKAKTNKKEQTARERLPHGSRFDLNYDAEKTMWTGTLIIGSVDTAHVLKFMDTAKSILSLLNKLDNKWRAWLRSQQSKQAVDEKSTKQ